MTLFDWVKDLFKDGVELYSDVRIMTQNNVTLQRDCSKLHKCSIGLISADTPEAWYTVCRLNCPVGTIIEPFDERWNSLYNDLLILTKLSLTERLVTERHNKSAKTLLDILERRAKSEWGMPSKDNQQLKIEQKEDKSLNISFDII